MAQRVLGEIHGAAETRAAFTHFGELFRHAGGRGAHALQRVGAPAELLQGWRCSEWRAVRADGG